MTTVAEAVARFRRAYGGSAVADARGPFRVRVGWLTLAFPNPGRLRIHDVHHVVLGLPPSFWGEVEISAFELRSGVPSALIGFLCVGALLLGALVSPRRVVSVWRKYGRCRNLYRDPRPYAEVVVMDVGALRRSLIGADLGTR